MWWLCVVDAAAPVGDIIYTLGILYLGAQFLTVHHNTGFVFDEEIDTEKAPSKKPDVKYPGDDPTRAPGEDYEWRGKNPLVGIKVHGLMEKLVSNFIPI